MPLQVMRIGVKVPCHQVQVADVCR